MWYPLDTHLDITRQNESQHFKNQSTQGSEHYVLGEVPIRVAPPEREGHMRAFPTGEKHTSMGTSTIKWKSAFQKTKHPGEQALCCRGGSHSSGSSWSWGRVARGCSQQMENTRVCGSNTRVWELPHTLQNNIFFFISPFFPSCFFLN